MLPPLRAESFIGPFPYHARALRWRTTVILTRTLLAYNLPKGRSAGLKKVLLGVAMSAIAAALPKLLGSIERPGDFSVGGVRPSLLPTIDVEGVGRIAFPVLPAQAEQLIAAAEAAPYGRGTETVIDRDVRRTWQVATGSLRVDGRHWDKTLAEIVAEAARGLGVIEPVAADFYKLLIYDSGSFFVDHRDTEKVPGMFATLVIVLPSAHSGGELVVRHLGREVTLDLRPDDPAELGFAAFYADCVHEVRPVVSGYRLTLVYNLRFLKKRSRLGAPDYREEQARVSELLKGWEVSPDEPDKLILPLEHAYTPAELSFGALKGADAGMASVLVRAADEADCDLHLALMTIEESGIAEQTAYYSRGRWRGGGDEEADDGEEFDVVEVSDQSMTLSEWRQPDGSTAGIGDLPFDQKELCPPDAFEEMTPDEQHFHEATGNEGATFERTYRRAGLVLWPRARRLAVLNHAGLRGTLPYLEDLVTRWQASGAAIDSPLRREADELSRHMLRTWPREAWRRQNDTDVSRALDLQVRLGNAAWVETFLAELSAEGHYAASDNEAIVHAVALLPAARATDLLVRIVRRNASAHLDACGKLLLLCATAPAGSAGDAAQVGTALIDSLPGAPEMPAEHAPWARPSAMTPGFVVDLLAATSRIDAGLAKRAVEHVLTWPKRYELDGVVLPAALALAKQKESADWPAVARLLQAALDHLKARIALPLDAPRDWARPNPLTCKCADCRQLGTFLLDPARRQWLFRAPQAQRSHVEDSVRNTGCDLDLATEKRGSPHTLIATKNQASYERRSTQRREDMEHVSALGG
jgi:predicted 2-oxoglutarate/Fe(II)-dependent dioxygenase YbiX